jgi:hypothetical protein
VAGAQALGELARRAHDDGEVGLAVHRQGRRQRDDDAVGVADGVVVGRRGKGPGLDERRERRRRDVLDVALAAVDGGDALGVDVDEHHRNARFRETATEGEADIARADNGDFRLHFGPIVQSTSAIKSAAWPSP